MDKKFDKLRALIDTNYSQIFNYAIWGEIKKRNNYLQMDRIQHNFDLDDDFINKHKRYLKDYVDILENDKSRHAYHTLNDMLLDNFFKVFAIVSIRKGLTYENISNMFEIQDIKDCFTESIFGTLINILNHRTPSSYKKKNLTTKDMYPYIEKEMLEEAALHFLPDMIKEALKSEEVLNDKDLKNLLSEFNYKNNSFANLKKKTDKIIIKDMFKIIENIKDDKIFIEEFLQLCRSLLLLKIDIKDTSVMERFLNIASNDDFINFMHKVKEVKKNDDKEISYFQNRIFLANEKRGINVKIEEDEQIVFRKIIKMKRSQMGLIFKYPRILECLNGNMYFKNINHLQGSKNDLADFSLNLELEEKIELSANEIINTINEIYNAELTSVDVGLQDKLKRTLVLKNKLKVQATNSPDKIKNIKKKI